MERFKPVNDLPARLSGLFFHRSSFFVICVAGLILSLAGLWAAKAAGTAADLRMRRNLVRQVSDIAAAINPANLRALSFTAEDQNRPEFIRLCSQLRAYAGFTGIGSLYTMALRDGQIVFGPESLEEGHPYASPPGTAYQKPSRQDFDLFATGRPQIQGPFSDEYGTFVTASAPVFDPVSGKVLAAVGLDVEASRWKSDVRRAQWIPAVITLVLLAVLFLSGLILQRYRRNPVKRIGRRKHAEPFLAAVFMTLLTGVLAVALDRNERISRRENFGQLARTHAAACAQEFYDLRNRIDQLVYFFESSEEVTREEFSSYCSNLVNQGAISACIWIPAVSCEATEGFVRTVRNTGLPEFLIWEKNPEGIREPVSPRPVYYPVLYIEPLRTRESTLGYDLNSELLRHTAIQEALKTGLATASDPVVPVSAIKNQSPGFVIFKPVKAAVQNGLAALAIRPENLLIGMMRQNKKNLGVDVCLLQLRHGKNPIYVTGSSGQCSLSCFDRVDSGLEFDYPVFRFGKAYALHLIPDVAWLAANPLYYGRTAGLLGLLVTLLVSSVIALVTNRRAFLERQIEQRTGELRVSEKRFRDIVFNSSDWVWEVDAQGRYTYVSDKSLNLTGYTPQELIGRTPFDLMPPEEAAKAEAFFTAAIRDHRPFRDYENWNIRKDGRLICLLTSGVPVFSDDGVLAGYRGTDADITARKQAEEALHLRESYLSAIIENQPGRVWIKDAEKRFRFVNQQFAKACGGRDSEELTGKTVFDVWPFEAAEKYDRDDCRLMESRAPIIEEESILIDGEPYCYETFKTVVLSEDGQVVGITGYSYDITERKQSEERIRQLAQHLETVREDERRRLARELHDDLGQILTALKIDLALVEDRCTCSGPVKQKMADMQKLLGEGIQSVHSLCRRLRPGALDDLGLEEAVEGLAEDWQRRNGIECNVETDLPDEDLPDAVKTAVFRIIQEALTNVSRYAKASCVTINMVADRQVLHFSITDNGCGMEEGAEHKPTSFGLLGMRERVEALGGHLRIKSAPGKGTRIDGTVPLSGGGALKSFYKTI